MANKPREYFFSDPQESNFLTSLYEADDNNNNLMDGVPHFAEIHRSFANHGLLQAVLSYGDSYDVSTNQLGSYSGGDFYISSSAQLYANNLGQRGLRSLGDAGDLALSELDIPGGRLPRSNTTSSCLMPGSRQSHARLQRRPVSDFTAPKNFSISLAGFFICSRDRKILSKIHFL